MLRTGYERVSLCLPENRPTKNLLASINDDINKRLQSGTVVNLRLETWFAVGDTFITKELLKLNFQKSMNVSLKHRKRDEKAASKEKVWQIFLQSSLWYHIFWSGTEVFKFKTKFASGLDTERPCNETVVLCLMKYRLSINISKMKYVFLYGIFFSLFWSN